MIVVVNFFPPIYSCTTADPNILATVDAIKVLDRVESLSSAISVSCSFFSISFGSRLAFSFPTLQRKNFLRLFTHRCRSLSNFKSLLIEFIWEGAQVSPHSLLSLSSYTPFSSFSRANIWKFSSNTSAFEGRKHPQYRSNLLHPKSWRCHKSPLHHPRRCLQKTPNVSTVYAIWFHHLFSFSCSAKKNPFSFHLHCTPSSYHFSIFYAFSVPFSSCGVCLSEFYELCFSGPRLLSLQFFPCI